MAQATQDSRPGQRLFDALAKKNDQLFWGGVAMAIVGALALLFPFGATLAIAIMAGWLLILAGAVTIADAFTVEGTGAFFGQLLIGLLKLALGVYLLRHPDVSMVLLTLLLAAVFVIDGARSWHSRSSCGRWRDGDGCCCRASSPSPSASCWRPSCKKCRW